MTACVADTAPTPGIDFSQPSSNVLVSSNYWCTHDADPLFMTPPIWMQLPAVIYTTMVDRTPPAGRIAADLAAVVIHPVENGSVTMQPELDLWELPAPDHRDRIVADSTDRVAWIRARSRGVTATDVARLSSERAMQSVLQDKLLGSGFGGNAYTDHGRAREPEITRWVRARHGIEPSSALYHAHGQALHLATPDGVAVHDGVVVLAEIKTTGHAWRSIPRSYLRQVWWQQYVLGAERTLVVWEQHEGFVPVHPEPRCQWVERDDNEIHVLVGLADRLLDLMRR